MGDFVQQYGKIIGVAQPGQKYGINAEQFQVIKDADEDSEFFPPSIGVKELAKSFTEMAFHKDSDLEVHRSGNPQKQ